MDRRYRIRVFDGGSEVLGEQKHWLALDLDNEGPGLREAEARLDALLQTLAHADGARGEDVRRYRLEVSSWVDDEVLFSWPARTWPRTDH